MKYIIALITFCVSSCLYAAAITHAAPLGYWRTIDDVTNKPKAIIQIEETTNQTLLGKIVKIYPRPGYDQNEVCEACEGALHNHRIVGMIIMENLTATPDHTNQWSGGKILDPQNGKTYRCQLQVSADGKTLQLRGYIGIPLFGRLQTWEKVDRVS